MNLMLPCVGRYLINAWSQSKAYHNNNTSECGLPEYLADSCQITWRRMGVERQCIIVIFCCLEIVVYSLKHYLCGFFDKEAQATKGVKRSSTGMPERACL